jgi:type I restriction enzyme S subunit
MLEKKLVPKLRFAEFGDKLNNIVLDKITSKISDGIHSTPKYDINGGYYFVNGNNLVDGVIVINNSTKKVSITEYEKHKRPLDDNSILLSINGTIGNIALYNHEKIVLGKSACYINLDKTLPVSFYYYIFQTPRVKKYFLSELTGSTIMNLSLRTIKATELITPSLPEQQKIASFLIEVDTKLSQLTKKKALLEDYKKGVMQQIFSQELRFKDGNGNDYGDWEEKKLGEVGRIVTGKTPSTTDKELWNGNIQFVTPTDINEDSKYQIETKRTVQNIGKLKLLPEKSIMYTCIASIGKMALSVQPCITNQQINSLIPNKEFDNEFIYYVLLKMTPKIKSSQTNTTLPIINKTEFSKFKISYPCLEEQTKIANFFSELDTKIEVLSTSIENTQYFKKGLLQQMFV